MRILVMGIKWETDGEEVDLSDEMVVEVPEGLLVTCSLSEIEDVIGDFIADELSNVSGWLHDGWEQEKIMSV